jgi:hypothetical protein
MGLLDGLMDNATELDASTLQQEFAPLLASDEQIQQAYQLIRDFFVFTNKRLILVDRQGLSGKKVEYHSLPYRSITQFSVQTAGHLDREAELRIWIAGSQTPIQKQFNKKSDIYHVQRVLAEHML